MQTTQRKPIKMIEITQIFVFSHVQDKHIVINIRSLLEVSFSFACIKKIFVFTCIFLYSSILHFYVYMNIEIHINI